MSNKVPDIDPKTGEPKWREWRKFKDEKIKKTVVEINEQTDLNIELIERKEGVQFAVKRKSSEFLPAPNRLNPEIAEAALMLGLKLTDIAALIRNGQSELGLKAAFAKMAKQDPASISRKLAYLNKILEEVNSFIGDGQTTAQYEQTVLPALTTPRSEPLNIALSFKEERRAQIRKEFSQLNKVDQRPFAYAGLAELKMNKMANPSMSLRVEAGQWDAAPILFAKMVDLYAVEKYGVDWSVEPSNEAEGH